MKIVFDARVHLNYFSGISRYIICLLEAYANLFPQDELTVLLNPTIESDNNIYKTLSNFKNVSFKVIDAGHMGPKNYYKMGKVIKDLNPDVYHYPHLDTPIFTGEVPIVATVHDTNSSKNVKKTSDKLGLKQFYFKKALSLTVKHASKVVFVSDSVKEEVESSPKLSKFKEKFVRVYNGLENDFNSISNQDINQQLENLSISEKYLFYVGQIREHKNIARIISAFKAFQKKNKEYKLVLVGHNFMQLDLNETNIIHLDKVTNKELKAIYAGCSAFLFPSLFEGFGFPILEAFSFGKPVVTSNYGATKEISGGLAYLVDPLSVTSITKGIEASLNSKGEEQRIQHAKKFTWEANAKQLRDIYLSVRR